MSQQNNSTGIILFIIVIIIILLIIWAAQGNSNNQNEKIRVRNPLKFLTKRNNTQVCYNKFCSKGLTCFNKNFNSRYPKQMIYSITYPGNNDSNKVPNIASYVNAFVHSETSTKLKLITNANPTGMYSCWCFDAFDNISVGTNYTCDVVSLLDPNIDAVLQAAYSCNPDHPLYTTYIAGILYLMNETQNYEVLGYSPSDIQTSIWTLLFTANPTIDTPVNTSPFGVLLGYNGLNVSDLIADAIAAQSAYNIDGDACKHILTTKIMGLLTLNNRPITSDTGCDQIMCLHIPMYELENCC